MRSMRLRLAAACTIVLGCVSVPATAQGCSGPGTFWKRDNLPIIPGLTAVAVVQGMCEGESAAVVFEMPASMPPQRIKQVVAPWGEGFAGVPGFQAELDVLIYDGVTFSGGIPNMGVLVFQLSTTGAGMQVQTHGLNTLDVSSYDIVVGQQPPSGSPFLRRFAVAFRTEINFHPTGSCAGGWPANYFTDTQPGFSGCTTPPRTSLIEIQGQGWRDASTATIGGFPLCPFAYNGVWCIRCCTEDAYPASYTTFAPGCPSSAGVSHLIPATLPRIGTTMLVIVDHMPISVGVMVLGFSNGPPLPLDVTFLGLNGCLLHVSVDITYMLSGGGGTAVHSLALPLDNTLLGLVVYEQALVLDNLPLNPFGGALSDAATVQIGL